MSWQIIHGCGDKLGGLVRTFFGCGRTERHGVFCVFLQSVRSPSMWVFLSAEKGTVSRFSEASAK